MGVVDPEKSAIEVKALLRRLHPKAGNHKDRIRRISKFRNYINSDSVRSITTVCIARSVKIDWIRRGLCLLFLFFNCRVNFDWNWNAFLFAHLSFCLSRFSPNHR